MVHSSGLVLAFGLVGARSLANPLAYLTASAADWNNVRSSVCLHSDTVLFAGTPAWIPEIGPLIWSCRF